MGWLEKYKDGGETIPITANQALKTFDFGRIAGTKQTKEKDKIIHQTIIHTPDQPMAGEGESWDQAIGRVLPTVKNIVDSAPANTTLITHNSVFGLIKLWDKQNRPSSFSKEQREKYTKQDDIHKPGDYYTIEGKNGPINIVRHGETQDNAKGNFRNDDTKLNRKGIKQANKLGKELSNVEIPQIITSPLDRTVHTADIITKYQEASKKKEEPVETIRKSEDGWLSKYTDGGDMQEHQPNFNDSNVSTPPNFEGLGTLNKGFNYNSAWGGSFQDGGGIPGSVGFSYARTGSTPSNGKYAKKTQSSAQNGMSFYQNGLDFKPKSISQDGSIIKDDNGYWNPDNWGKPVEIGSNDITMQGVQQPLLGISDSGDTKIMTPGKDYKFKGKKVREYPIAKDGKELTKLDQLTNFTNYNKPTAGGWLSKYE